MRSVFPHVLFILLISIFIFTFFHASASETEKKSAVDKTKGNTESVPTLKNTQIEAGWYHACAISHFHRVKCWGKNWHGELGHKQTSTNYKPPSSVVDLDDKVKAIAAGWSLTCALTSPGAVKCWGWNANGQLGAGKSEYESPIPMDVTGLSKEVAAIDAGGEHACALLSKGQLQCWGKNNYGQLGDGTTKRRKTPVNVIGFKGKALALAAGWYHTCAIKAGGGVMCWGLNGSGQLGNGTKDDQLLPADVKGMKMKINKIAAGGGHTCAITSSGSLKCWGRNSSGQLGDGTKEYRTTPVDVQGLSTKVLDVAAGEDHSCVVMKSGSVKCWGGNQHGQLGDKTNEAKEFPVDVDGLSGGVVSISAGYHNTCALLKSGVIMCWGATGVVGNSYQDGPVEVPGTQI